MGTIQFLAGTVPYRGPSPDLSDGGGLLPDQLVTVTRITIIVVYLR
jgi:hypothetical protein